MEHKGYQQYREQSAQSVQTMSAHELLLLLYDELVKRTVRCELALKQQNYALLEESADRCLAILRYLDDTLDQSYDISRDLSRLYDFFAYEFNRVKLGRNQEVLLKLKPMLIDLRDTFHQAAKNCAAGAGQAVQPAAGSAVGGVNGASVQE